MGYKKLGIVPVLGAVLLVASCGTGGAEDEPQAQSGDENLSAPPAPEICEYHEEVSEVPDDEQFERALELGCDYGIHGEIVFAEPIRVDGDDYTDSLTDPSRAMSIEEMREAGYSTE